MQNSSGRSHNDPPVYTDSDINALLDTITHLREDNHFILREHERIMVICHAIKLDILHLQSVNELLEQRLKK